MKPVLVKKLFPAQEHNEKVFLVIRRHWFTYTLFWFLTFWMLVPFFTGLIYWVIRPDQISYSLGSILIILAAVYLLSILGLLLYGFIDYYLDIYIITNKRIVDIKQNGFFKREISELNLRQVQDVKASVNGFFATLFHYGEVDIQTAGERENFNFKAIPHPYRISKVIIDLHEQTIKRGGRSSIENELETIESDLGHVPEMNDFNEGPLVGTELEEEKKINAKPSDSETKKETKPSNEEEMKEGESIKL